MRNVEQVVREIVGDHALSTVAYRDSYLDGELQQVDVGTLSRETLHNLVRYVSGLDVRPDLMLSLVRKLCNHPHVRPGENLNIVLQGPLLQLFNPALACVPFRPNPVVDVEAAMKLATDGDFWSLYEICSSASPAFSQALAAEMKKAYPTPILLFLLEKLKAGNRPAPSINSERQQAVEMLANMNLHEAANPAELPPTDVLRMNTVGESKPEGRPHYESGLHPVIDGGIHQAPFDNGLHPLPADNGLYPVPESGLHVVSPTPIDNGLHPVSSAASYASPQAPVTPAGAYMHLNPSVESFSKSRFFRKDKSPKPSKIMLDLPGEKSIALSPDCKHAVIWTQWQIALVETSGKMHPPLPVSNVVMATMSDNCVALIRRTTEDEIVCYRLRNLIEKRPPFLQLRRSPVTALCVSPNGSWLAVGYNGFVEVHSFASITQLRTYQIAGECTSLSFNSKELLVCARSGDTSHLSGSPPPYTTLFPLVSIDANGAALRVAKNVFLEKYLIDPAGNATQLDFGPVYMAVTDEKTLVLILLDGTIYRVGKGRLANLPRLYSRYQQFGATQIVDAKVKDGFVRVATMGSNALEITNVALL